MNLPSEPIPEEFILLKMRMSSLSRGFINLGSMLPSGKVVEGKPECGWCSS